MSGASYSGHETHSNPGQLPLREQVARVDQTSQNSVRNTKDSPVREGLQGPLTGTKRGYEHQDGLHNIQNSPVQQLLPGNQLPFSHPFSYQHQQQQHPQQHHRTTTTVGGKHVTTSNARRKTRAWDFELYKVFRVKESAEERRKLVKTWHVVEAQ